jgi:hypothetical protein
MPAYLLVMEGEEAQRRGRYADIPAQGLGFQAVLAGQVSLLSFSS